MPENGTTIDLRGTVTPVIIRFRFGDDDGIEPFMNIEHEGARSLIFDHFDVDDIEELTDEVVGDYTNVDERRVGVIAGKGDDMTFHSDTELLALVDGISTELAAGLVDFCGDINTICERQRENADSFLGTVWNDAEVKGHEWTGELGEFIDSLDAHDTLERRMKAENIWSEPQHAVA